jgi:hypothetical protein
VLVGFNVAGLGVGAVAGLGVSGLQRGASEPRDDRSFASIGRPNRSVFLSEKESTERVHVGRNQFMFRRADGQPATQGSL